MLGKALEVLVLGSAQDGGVPQVGCRCANCRHALATGEIRWSSSLAVRTVAPPVASANYTADRVGARGHRILLDAGPDLRSQLRRFPGPVDAVLLTHLHMGHYAGILEFGREVTGRQDLAVWCSPAVAGVLESNSPWAELASQRHVVYRPFALGEPFCPAPGMSVTAHLVAHRNELADTVGFHVRAAGGKAETGQGRHYCEGTEAATGGLVYIPDADRWEGLRPPLRELVTAAELAVLDGTFYDHAELGRVTGREIREVPHPPVEETLAMLGELASRVVFSHLNHTNPLLDPESAASRHVLAGGARIAREGQIYRVGERGPGSLRPGGFA